MYEYTDMFIYMMKYRSVGKPRVVGVRREDDTLFMLLFFFTVRSNYYDIKNEMDFTLTTHTAPLISIMVFLIFFFFCDVDHINRLRPI